MVKATIVQAVNMALDLELGRDRNVVVMGEDVGVNGGVFRATDGLQKKHGKERVIDTPLSEEAIIGTAVGMAVNGMRPVAEIQFSGFVYSGFDQLFSHAARIRNRSRGRFSVPLVVRTPAGAGIRALELHCEQGEAFFAHAVGLKMVIPSTPYDAKGLLLAAIRDPDPVIFYEPMRLYRAIKEDIPEDDYTVPIGKARIAQQGDDLTVISWGALSKFTLDAIQNNKVNAEVIDLRSIYPWDSEAVLNSVKKTGRAVIVHEAPRTSGFGAEIAATIAERAMLELEAPVVRVTGYDTAVPFARTEMEYVPSEKRIMDGVNKVLKF
ncbi:alpha-ketoacid dehydrogenase subunit beta [Candidatus Woesearchaeota archaeon]|nr:alpha-ketoacid dehydrogenase subunit beta [Candidatus Woesearchaeota archaeon]